MANRASSRPWFIDRSSVNSFHEEPEHLLHLRDLLLVELDVPLPDEEREHAAEQRGAVLLHQPDRLIRRVEDVPGVADDRFEPARADGADALAGARVEDVEAPVEGDDLPRADREQRLRLRLVREG